MAIYKGFSTKSFNYSDPASIVGLSDNDFGPYNLNDKNLIIMDLINHFNIRKGQKLMNPDYGTVIWDLIFEPFNDATKQAIETDIKRVVSSDPRIGVRSAVITQYDRGVQIELDLVFVQTNQAGTLALQFDQQSKSITRV